MALVHNVEIIWDELLNAFTSEQVDRVYFLDRQSGEIFNVPSALDDENFWRQMETNQERFLEIPSFDYGTERKIMSDFIGAVQDTMLKDILCGSLIGRKPHGDINEILSFFPNELERFQEMKDEFLTTRVKQWLETNNLFTMETGIDAYMTHLALKDSWHE